MVLKYYFDLFSQPARALWIYFKAAGIPFESCNVAVVKGEHLKSWYRQVNPLRQVPAIDHDGFKLRESVAILRYVQHSHQPEDNWYPTEARPRARLDEYLCWHPIRTRKVAHGYNMLIHYPRIMGTAPAPDDVTHKARAEVDVLLTQLEELYLSRTRFVNSDSLSAADLLAVCELTQLLCSGLDAFSDRPRLQQWRDDVIGLTQPYWSEAHTLVNRIHKKYYGSKV